MVSARDESRMGKARDAMGSPPASREAKSSAAGRAEPITFRLRVKDASIAGAEVRAIPGELGARNIARQQREGAEVITANLKTEKVEDLYEKLSIVGEIDEKITRPGPAAEESAVSIQIEGNPFSGLRPSPK